LLQIIDHIKGGKCHLFLAFSNYSFVTFFNFEILKFCVDVEETLRAEGPGGAFKAKLRDYCAHCCETAAKLMN
jgi:hypothetical protein